MDVLEHPIIHAPRRVHRVGKKLVQQKVRQMWNSWRFPPWEFESFRASTTRHRIVWTVLASAICVGIAIITTFGPLLAPESLWLVGLGIAVGLCAGVSGMYDLNDTYTFSIEMPISLALVLAGHPVSAVGCVVASLFGQQLRRHIVPHLLLFNCVQASFAILFANVFFQFVNDGSAIGDARWALAATVAAVFNVFGYVWILALDQLTGLTTAREGVGVLMDEMRFMIPVGLMTGILCAALVSTPVGIIALFFPIIFQRAVYANVGRALKALQESLSDPLTSLGNRRMFDENVDSYFNVAEPEKVFGLFIDLDHFKRLNDTLGHDAGDEALVKTARVIKSGVRSDDLACRIGGEEFVVLFNAHSRDIARDVGERLRIEIQRQLVSFEVTASIGVAQVRVNDSPAELVRRGDETMYRAKRNGRNRVVVDWDDHNDAGHLYAVA